MIGTGTVLSICTDTCDDMVKSTLGRVLCTVYSIQKYVHGSGRDKCW